MKLNKIKKIPQYVNGKVLRVLDKIQLKRRRSYLKKQCLRLNNKEITLISNNCNGGVLLHELGLRFNSPFVNMNIPAEDYVRYLARFEYYNSLTPVFDERAKTTYPVGKLDDVTVEFIHYKSNEEAFAKWEERKKRMNSDNLFVIFTEQKDCTPELVEAFDQLPFQNKVVFTHRRYDHLKSAVYLERFKDNPLGVHMFLGFKNHFSAKRKYDVFDFVAWFNGETDFKKLLKG